MPTRIHGISASANLDSSGEIVSIEGMDISSLEHDGTLTYEHDNKSPSSVVGKILKARKIFSEKDCEDDHQLYFWNKIKTPYVYIMGELFDDYKDSAREVAGMFRYDADHKGQNSANVMNFSIEGHKLSREGNVVTKSIARKTTLTTHPCNKVAIAEMVPAPAQDKKDDIDSIFKTESAIEIELFAPSNPENFAELVKKDAMKKDMGLSGIGSDAGMAGVAPSSPSLSASEKMAKSGTTSSRGTRIGITSSNKPVWSHGRIAEYAGFSSKDHKDAANLHLKAAHAAGNDPDSKHHMGKTKLHMQAASSAEKREKRGPLPVSLATAKTEKNLSDMEKMARVDEGKSPEQKAWDRSGRHDTTSIETHTRAPGKVGAFFGQKPKTRTNETFHSKASSLNPNSRRGSQATPGHGPQTSGGVTSTRKVVGHIPTANSKAGPIKPLPKSEMTKALDAGSGMAAPSQLVGGAALAKESLEGKRRRAATKSPWFTRAEQEYQNWSKREEFENYMAKKMPHLAKGEVRAIGAALVLKKSMAMEKALSRIVAPKK